MTWTIKWSTEHRKAFENEEFPDYTIQEFDICINSERAKVTGILLFEKRYSTFYKSGCFFGAAKTFEEAVEAAKSAEYHLEQPMEGIM